MSGILYGVGVGPGDPELLSLKAARLIRDGDVIAYLTDADGESMARRIANDCLMTKTNPTQVEEAIIMPMCQHRDQANAVYDRAAQTFAHHLGLNRNVVFLCQGDPFFFGSFAYIHQRLRAAYECQIIPGITAISACAALGGQSLGLLAENFAVVSGRHRDAEILDTLQRFDNVAIIKPGRRRPALLALITRAGRAGETCYIEFAGQPNQNVVRDISLLERDQTGPYFSLFLIIKSRNF